MLARQIKDLSIALEALTRVPDSSSFRSAIKDILARAIDMQRKELMDKQYSAQTINPTLTDDEIPF